MSTFKQYLTEAHKSYDYKVKVAGPIASEKGFATKMETALQKFEVAKMSAGKKTPIMTMPLDFPALSNEEVTIFDVTSEEYQEQMQVAEKSEYVNKLRDIEYKDAPKVNAEDFHSTKANMSLLKELLKDREEDKDMPKENPNIQSKEEVATPSPFTKSTNPHPDPARK